MKWPLIVAAGFSPVWLFWPQFHKASAIPEPDLEVAISIRSMSGIHSDWHRRISVTYLGHQISKDLMGDTGWWRGSNLYLHTSGSYVLHEGQGWCFGVSLEPLEFHQTDASCVKGDITTSTLEGHSAYYSNLIYLGHFYETRRDEEGVRIRYSEAGQTSEVELPDGP